MGNQEHYQKTGKKLAAVSTFIKDGRVYYVHKHTQNWAHTAEWECMKRCRRKVSTCTAWTHVLMFTSWSCAHVCTIGERLMKICLQHQKGHLPQPGGVLSDSEGV
jgi:hypothetical protein